MCSSDLSDGVVSMMNGFVSHSQYCEWKRLRYCENVLSLEKWCFVARNAVWSVSFGGIHVNFNDLKFGAVLVSLVGCHLILVGIILEWGCKVQYLGHFFSELICVYVRQSWAAGGDGRFLATSRVKAIAAYGAFVLPHMFLLQCAIGALALILALILPTLQHLQEILRDERHLQKNLNRVLADADVDAHGPDPTIALRPIQFVRRYRRLQILQVMFNSTQAVKWAISGCIIVSNGCWFLTIRLVCRGSPAPLLFVGGIIGMAYNTLTLSICLGLFLHIETTSEGVLRGQQKGVRHRRLLSTCHPITLRFGHLGLLNRKLLLLYVSTFIEYTITVLLV